MALSCFLLLLNEEKSHVVRLSAGNAADDERLGNEPHDPHKQQEKNEKLPFAINYVMRAVLADRAHFLRFVLDKTTKPTSRDALLVTQPANRNGLLFTFDSFRVSTRKKAIKRNQRAVH